MGPFALTATQIYSPAPGGALLAAVGLTAAGLGAALLLWAQGRASLLRASALFQLGFAFFGIGLGLAFRIPLSVQGGLFHLLAAAAAQGLAGVSVSRRAGEWNLGRGLACLCLVGLPPTAGFMSRVLVLRAALQVGGAGAYMAAGAVLLSAVCLPGYLRLFVGGYDEENSGQVYGHTSTWLAIMLAILIILFGLAPQLALWLIGPISEMLVPS